MKTDQLPDCRVSLSGPFTTRRTGKFRDNGDPVKTKCPPYWVVRKMVGTRVQDDRYGSESAARAAYNALAPCDLI